MTNFWDSNVWSGLLIIAILFAFMLIAHILRRKIPFLSKSLLPPSVLGGVIILIFTTIFKLVTKENFFELEIFQMGNISGIGTLEVITYHALAVGFICMGLKSSGNKKHNKKRTTEIFNTGVTTVTTYLIQAVVGLTVTMLAAVILKDLEGFNPAAGIILCLGYGQGTGQALNFGTQYQVDYGFKHGADFGLAVAAMGFLVASIGGVIVLNILKRKGKINVNGNEDSENLDLSHYQTHNEIPVNGSIDKLTIQIAWSDARSSHSNPVVYKEKKVKREVESKDNVKAEFSIDGIHYFSKINRFVLMVVKQYVSEHPNITIEELEDKFPAALIGNKTRGFIRTLDFVRENNYEDRFFTKSDDLIRLKDSTIVAVCSQWGNSGYLQKFFIDFLDYIKTIYPLYIR